MTDKILGKRYRVLKKIGEGELGTTFHCTDRLTEKEVALKVVHTSRIADREVFSNFYSTFRAYMDLDHPHIVHALDSGLVVNEFSRDADPKEPVPFLVFDYFPSRSLSTPSKKKHIPVPEALGIFTEITAIVNYLHKRGFIHRGLKPENILIGKEKEIKVLHFGLFPRKPEPPGSQKTMDIARAAAWYTSPEIAMGQKGDMRSDLYSLGIILYELLTGTVPFNADSPEDILLSHIKSPPPPPRKHNAAVVRKLEELVLQLLEKNPTHRFSSCQDLLDELARLDVSKESPEVEESTLAASSAALPLTIPLVKRKEKEKIIREFIRGGGKRAMLIIRGAPGTGKKRLVNEAAEFARLLGMEFYNERCNNLTRAPFDPFIRFVRNFLTTKKRTIRELMGQDWVLSVLLGERGFRAIESEDPNRPFLQERQILESFLSFFKNISGERVILLHIDDIQWADASSLSLLHYLAEHFSGEKVLIMTSFAPETPGQEEALHELLAHKKVKELEIVPLSQSECEQLVRNMTHTDIIPAEFLSRLFKKSGGNALYIVEAIKKLITDGRIQIKHKSLFGNPDDLDKLPSSLFDLVQQRARELPEGLRELYKTASTIGKTFSLKMLWEAMGRIPEKTLETLLERGKRLGYHLEEMYLSRTSYYFSHNMVRDAFYDLIPLTERRSFHTRIGTLIEEMHFDNPIGHFEELLTHFSIGCDDDRTIYYTIRAADKCALIGAHGQAISYYDKALELIGGRTDKMQERWKCFHNSGIIHLRMQRAEKALECQKQALALSEKKRDLAAIQECLFLIADILMMMKDYRKAGEVICDALAYETMKDNIWRSKLLSRRGKIAMISHYEGRTFEDALMDVKEGFRIAQELRNIDATIETSEILASLFTEQNMVDEGEKFLSKILNFRIDSKTRLRIIEKLGRLFIFPGCDYPKARNYLEDGLDYATEFGDASYSALFSLDIGVLCCETGELERAHYHLADALEYFRHRDEIPLTECHLGLGKLYAIKGDFKKALIHIEKADDALSRSPSRAHSAEAELLKGDIALKKGRIKDARFHYEQARTVSGVKGFFRGSFFSVVGLAEVCLCEDDLEGARERIVEALHHNKRGENRLGGALLLILQAVGHLIEKNPSLALQLLHNAEEQMEKLGRPYDLGRIALEQARALRQEGQKEQAAALFQKAAEFFTKLENNAMVKKIEKESARLP
ncbi:MAG: protein kinase [Candidatus Eremiobacteraeota bacterium]|nr:protein kinase [Candidatus Eremiobacteraeota bacterium]